MSLLTEISRMKSMMGITESTIEDGIQNIVDQSINKIQGYTTDMGLGEMDELEEIESIDRVKVVDFVNDEVPVLYVDFHVNSNRRDFDLVMSELQYEIGKYIPKVQLVLNDIVDNRTFGPGIDF